MSKNFFKPKFRILKYFTKECQQKGFVVSIRYWWFPIWMQAMTPNGNSRAIFEKEEDALDYIKRRYDIITFENHDKRGKD